MTHAALIVVAQGLALFTLASAVFDAIHFALHRCAASRWSLLRHAAAMHRVHHDFFDGTLSFNPAFAGPNMLRHALPEYATQLAVCLSAFLLLTPIAVVAVLGIFTAMFAGSMLLRGRDWNHVATHRLPAAHDAIRVGASYHAMHHIYSDGYFGSCTTLFDRLAGTACVVRGRTFALTGVSGAFGGAMKTLLERAGANVIGLPTVRKPEDLDAPEILQSLLRTDVLVLCHGAKGADAQWANCDSFVSLIETFKGICSDRLVPAEVWAVGSEIECHPTFGLAELQSYARSKREFARRAAGYFYDRELLYRHIVPSSFRSGMGGGLMSAGTAARISLGLILRGFRYVPATYTGVAVVNALPFLIRARLARPTQGRPGN